KGMLFLDEIGELGLDEHAMILRTIKDKRLLPVGADSEAASDFQLLAGTNRDLGQAVVEGHFRDDVYARLNLWTFAARPCRPARGHRAQPRLRTGPFRRTRRNAGYLQQGGAIVTSRSQSTQMRAVPATSAISRPA
ncbi:MAG TPA: sigma 54-interacting transcriptional regulator, partial [Sphingomicrobium sp.]